MQKERRRLAVFRLGALIWFAPHTFTTLSENFESVTSQGRFCTFDFLINGVMPLGSKPGKCGVTMVLG